MAADDKMSAVALTDAGNMFGAVAFYQKATAQNIKPIIGLDPYVTSGSRFDRKTAKDGDISFRIGLLAKNNAGYQNLMKLATFGYTEGFYYSPRIDFDILKKYSEGLICLSGFAQGPLGYYYLNQQDDKAEEYLHKLLSIFDKDHLYLEVQRHNLPEREIIIQKYKDLAERYQVPLVATNDVYYPSAEDVTSHEVLLCLQSGKKLDDEKRMRFPSSEFYFKTQNEMKDLFPDMPEAIENTSVIADRCDVTINFNKRYLPCFDVPEGYSSDSYLRKLCLQELPKKYPDHSDKEKDRLEFELKTILDMGFPDYFLIVSDFIHYAKNQGMPVGPGRGSAAGSIVSYLMDITTIDPLKYNLLFERFLNPARISMPDIDIDFCKNERAKVIEYVTEKYGRDCVAQIITYGTMAAKMVVRDVGRVLNIPLSEVDRLAKLIPTDPKIKLKNALEQIPELKEAYSDRVDYKGLFDIALKLEGMVRQPGIHAAGIIISAQPLTEMTPLYKSGNDITTQYEAGRLEELGLLKMDFLGLKNLTIIAEACAMIKDVQGLKLNVDNLALEDQKTYDLLSSGHTIGVFQLESDGMRNLAKNMGVENFEVIIALLALYRPGPLDWAPDFIERKHGRQEIEYLHPQMEPILKETYGVMLYQEQVMQSVSKLAGFTLAEADLLRRAMGKKKNDVMAAQREKFVQGCADKHKIAADLAHKIFDTIYKFAGYGFNKSHSAAYSLISYQTAYLKANYSVEYMAALLTHSMDNTDKVVLYIEECRRMNLAVLPPDVNESSAAFTVVKDGIRFGLSAVKNVGAGPIEAIIDIREKEGPYSSLFDFCKRVDMRLVNKRAMESLIKTGAMDSFGAKRSQMIQVLDRAIKISHKDRKDKERGQSSLFDLMNEEDKKELSMDDIPDIDEWQPKELLSYEKELVGFYVTGHPLEEYKDLLKLYATEGSLTIEKYKDVMPKSGYGRDRDFGVLVRVGGLLVDVRTILTRKGDKMAFVKLEDLEGSMEITVFPKTYDMYKEFLVVDQAIFLEGKAGLNQRNNTVQVIATKIIELKNVAGMYTDLMSLKVDSQKISPQWIQQLQSLLQQFHGDCPVILELALPDKEKIKMEIGSQFMVNPQAELKEKVEEILGRGTVILGEAK
jgi:DNA polymerase-3 subunit alpha